MQNLLNDLAELLKTDERLVTEGRLVKNKIIELALQTDADLLKMLLQNPTIKAHFFTEVEQGDASPCLVFDKIKFMRFVANKQFLPDSYTAYKNKVGLIKEGDYLDNYITKQNDVVLAWPYKDTVLQGGQTKEDDRRNEIFWNETLAPDQIDRLLYPKVLTNWKKYDKDGVHQLNLQGFKNLEGLPNFDRENLIIKGNNLLALHSLKQRYAGKVKLIYIDPPYNTDNGGFNYNDSFTHSTWMTFMKNRIAIAYKMLRKDGVLVINSDEIEHAYLKILCDEIFGRENFRGDFIWKKRKGGGNDSFFLALDHDYLLVFNKDSSKSIHNKWRVPYDEEYLKRYKETDENGNRYYWDTISRDGLQNPIVVELDMEDGTVLTINSQKSKDTILTELEKGLVRITKTKSGGWSVQHRVYKPEGKVARSILDNVGTNKTAKDEQVELFGKSIFNYPKPEKLISLLINLLTNENDLVLDFFIGSGTTAAVAHKMNRRYIGIEQLDYIEPIPVARLQKVIGEYKEVEKTETKNKKAEQETLNMVAEQQPEYKTRKLVFDEGGISKAVNWQGGGSFVYCELMQYNQKYIDQIMAVSDVGTGHALSLQTATDQLLTIWEDMRENAFLNYLFNNKKFDENIEAFKKLHISEQQRFLFDLLDKNQLYLNYGEMEDETYGVSEADKKLNNLFYGKK